VPTFSVVVTAYESASTVAAAIDSALAQTRSPHEVVVVDDGSTDDTPGVLDRYGDRISRIRQENRGVAAATNAGVAAATGEFVAILNADDVFEPGRLEVLDELARERPELDILMTDLAFEVDGHVTGRFCEQTPFAFELQELAILERCSVAEPAIRRAALLAAGGFDESLRIGEDWECWIRLITAGARVGLVPEPLVRYRLREDSLTADRAVALRSRVTVLERALELPLSPEQRRLAESLLPRRRRRADVAAAESAVRGRDPSARRRALAVARMRDVPVRTRLAALAAAIAPARAAVRLAGGSRRALRWRASR
jgi:GT2 family glycosyltransferase